MIKDVIITTDLYHEHGDPNDHFNLAAMYALDKLGLINLVGIMCDDDKAKAGPDGDKYLHFGDPSVQSVAQLNYITGRFVPVGVGSRKPIKNKDDLIKATKTNIASVNLLLSALENTKTKVDVHICGSSRDVVIAAAKCPELFHEKCGGIFINAGNYGSNDPIEYNVTLDPFSFSEIFKIPCDIYWGPCFEKLTEYPYNLSERGTYYEIEQEELLPLLSDNMKKYFKFMFDYVMDTGWLSYLRKVFTKTELEDWAKENKGKRQMWSTPGFLKSANLSANVKGDFISPIDTNAIFDYLPINITVSHEGEISWKNTTTSNIYMFKNKGANLYAKSMTEVIKRLYKVL